jgi:phosphate transport system protein
MTNGTHYAQALADLQQQLLWLGKVVERAVVHATWALLHRDTSAARRVKGGDHEIDDLRFAVEEQALVLIARRQPFAGDLRAISAVIGVAAELERIGDYAEGISKTVLRRHDLPPVEPPQSLVEMVQTARVMFEQAMQAIVDRDPEACHRLQHTDERVDALYQVTLKSLITTMHERPQEIESALYLIWAAHNVERIADRTVNIAERAAFVAGHPPAPRGSEG